MSFLLRYPRLSIAIIISFIGLFTGAGVIAININDSCFFCYFNNHNDDPTITDPLEQKQNLPKCLITNRDNYVSVKIGKYALDKTYFKHIKNKTTEDALAIKREFLFRKTLVTAAEFNLFYNAISDPAKQQLKLNARAKADLSKNDGTPFKAHKEWANQYIDWQRNKNHCEVDFATEAQWVAGMTTAMYLDADTWEWAKGVDCETGRAYVNGYHEDFVIHPQKRRQCINNEGASVFIRLVSNKV